MLFGLKWRVKDFFYMFLAGLFVVVFSAIVNHAMGSGININKVNAVKQNILKPFEEDFVIGDKNAPIEIVFYGDFTCHHCMRFMDDVFLELNKKYISKKKVKFIFRPVISLKRSLYGSKFLFCDKRTDAKNADILSKMFNKKWMMSEDYINALAKLVKKENWSSVEHFVECVNSKKIQNILQKMYKTKIEPLDIHETPHVFINKTEITADKYIFKYIDRELKKYKKQ